MTLDMRFSTSNYGATFPRGAIEELKIKLEASEKQLIEYAQKEALSMSTTSSRSHNGIQGVSGRLFACCHVGLLVQETWSQAQADGGASLPQVMSDALIQSARASCRNCGQPTKTG